MTPYNHLRSQHCNASWRGQFMYIAQHLTHRECGPAGAVGPHAWILFPRSHPETTLQVFINIST